MRQEKNKRGRGLSHACFKQGQFIVGLEMLAKEKCKGAGFRRNFRCV